MVAGDFNDDGWPDLYVGVYDDRNRLFLNDGQGRFEDATTGEVGDSGNAFGVAVGDIDNDLDLDIFQANGIFTSGQLSVMLLNLGEGNFQDITEGVGLSSLRAAAASPGLADIDNDGDLDLVLASDDYDNPPHPRALFINNGDGLFIAEPSLYGLSPYAEAAPFLSVGDYTGDGFLDIWFEGVVSRNRGNENHWLRVDLVGLASNRNGIGARLVATAGDLEQRREILGGKGRNLDELVAHFGLGQHPQVDRLEIRWPSGQVDVVEHIPADQKIRVFEGREGYHVVQPTVWEKAPPDVLVGGSTVDFIATVRPALFEAGAQITNVTADLSKVGGPVEVPLVDGGDGTYRLEASLGVGEPQELKDVSIRIEQSTSLGSYWTQLSKRILLAPPADLLIFGDTVADAWQLEASRGLEMNPAAETLVYQGQSALELQPERSWSVAYVPAVSLSTVGYTALRFAFHPGDATGNSFSLSIKYEPTIAIGDSPYSSISLLDGDLEGIGVDLEVKDWQVVEIPLETLGLESEWAFNLKAPIGSIRFFGNLKGTFYLDDIRLITAAKPSQPITAVLEEHTATLPQIFVLEQNYPNPFNSSTVIRFALPQAENVELAVYNLAGQKVATLVEGVREAGVYTVRWDGRDESGRELASGVYLYRLRAGQGQVETRKLLLLQ